jgi:4-amino-4-deoxy-L-arabinose transferase-like glycosyltransferase
MRWQRLRWRMRGAWMWPTFGVVTLAEGILLSALPPYAEGPGGVVPGVLLAGFANLVAVAVVAPLAGRRVRRRHPDLPRAIANDYAGTALIWIVAVGFLVAGLAHRPAMRETERDRGALFAAVHTYVSAQAPDHEAFLSQADSIRLAEDFYRACVPGPDGRPLCLFVETDQSPAGIRRDGDRTPNSSYRLP